MRVAIPLGSAVLQRSGYSAVVLPWVVLVVGLHFLPMARAFEATLLLRLGVTLVALGLLGGLLALLLGPGVSPWVGVIRGASSWPPARAVPPAIAARQQHSPV